MRSTYSRPVSLSSSYLTLEAWGCKGWGGGVRQGGRPGCVRGGEGCIRFACLHLPSCCVSRRGSAVVETCHQGSHWHCACMGRQPCANKGAPQTSAPWAHLGDLNDTREHLRRVAAHGQVMPGVGGHALHPVLHIQVAVAGHTAQVRGAVAAGQVVAAGGAVQRLGGRRGCRSCCRRHRVPGAGWRLAACGGWGRGARRVEVAIMYPRCEGTLPAW